MERKWVAPASALTVWALSAGLLAMATAMLASGWSTPEPGGLGAFVSWVVLASGMLAFSSGGALIVVRRGYLVGWLLLAAGAGWIMVLAADVYLAGSTLDMSRPGAVTVSTAWLMNWVWLVGLAPISLLFLTFPDGRLPSRRWRPALWVWVGGVALAIVARTLPPGPLAEFPAISNPIGFGQSTSFFATVESVGFALWPVSFLAGLLALAVRWRGSTGAARMQLRWLMAGGLLVLAGFSLANVAEAFGDPAGVADQLRLFPLPLLAATVTVALLRWRLYDLDLVVNRTVLWFGMAAAVTGVYIAIVAGVGALVGGSAGSDLRLAVLATAASALLIEPIHRRTRAMAHRIAFGRSPGRPPASEGRSKREARWSTDVEVVCLGAFRVFRGGEVIPARAWRSRKARTLFQLLVIRRGRAVTRDEAMDLLWPGEDPTTLTNRLSVAVSTIRAVLDSEHEHPADFYVVTDRDVLRIDTAHLSSDLDRFVAAADVALRAEGLAESDEAEALLVQARALYPGDLIEDEPYADWIQAPRGDLRRLAFDVTRALATSLADDGRVDEAARLFAEVLAEDPFEEVVHLRLIAELSRVGRHGEAERCYRNYVCAMAELGVPAVSKATAAKS